MLGNKVQYKKQEDEIPITPPLPWNARRPIRSYSTEMLNYPRHHHQERPEWRNYDPEQCPPLERYSGDSSGYHSGPPTKPHNGHKPSSGHRKSAEEHDYHSLTRSHPHRHSTETRKSSSANQNQNNKNIKSLPAGSKPHKSVTKKAGHDSHFFVDY